MVEDSFIDTMLLRPPASLLGGARAAGVIWDEFSSFPVPKRLSTIATFHDERFPEADVQVEENRLDKRDPRNPNPAAGCITEYVIIAGKRRYPPEQHSATVAKINAEELHKRLIAALEDEQNSRMPGYGVFS